MMEYREAKQPEMKLREVLAAVVNGGWKVIIWGLVAALLFGVFGMITSYTLTKEPDQEYTLAVVQYEMTRQQLEDTIERATKEFERQKNYNENSLLMGLDPYNKYVTTIVFAISDIDVSKMKGYSVSYETPVRYITDRIVAQYTVLWDGMDLEKLVEGTGYAGADDKYLREVITLVARDGGVLQLSVISNDKTESEKVAASIYQALMANKGSIEKGSYSHELAQLHDVFTKETVDLELEEKQQENIGNAEKCHKELMDAQKALLTLSQPKADTGIGSVAKKAVLGGMIGAVLCVVWLAVAQVLQNKLTGAKQMMDSFPLICLGSVAKRGGIWSRMAGWMLSEKTWKDQAQAIEYVREKCAAHVPENSTVALITSLPAQEDSLLEDAVQAMSTQGRNVILVTDANHNPKAISAIRECDGVVLAERAYKSRAAVVADVLLLAEEMQKPVCGFVMI